MMMTMDNSVYDTVKVLTCLCLLAGWQSVATGRKYNVTTTEIANCKEYDIRDSGYSYHTFFRVNMLRNNKMADDELLHLKFYVMAAMDAHILLSVTRRPKPMDRVYEIVIGAGGNTFSTIRIHMGRRRVSTSQEQNLLSAFDPTPIEIIQKRDGNLFVYITGLKEEPLMNFTDNSPLNINYISFSSFGSVMARWFYDCSFDFGFENEIKEEERPLTPLERLIGNISAKALDKTLPKNLKQINFAFQIRSVSFNQDSSVLRTRMHLILYWNDLDLKWKSEDFGGIDILSEPSLEIWTPQIAVINGALKTFRHFNPTHELKVLSNGSVYLIAADAEIYTWCLNANRNWPHESIGCEVILGLQRQHLLNYEDNTIELVYDGTSPFSQEPVNTLSEWNFVKISVTKLPQDRTARHNDTNSIQRMDGDLSIGFTIFRNSTFYRNVFSTPILTCQSLIILGFLLRGYRRGALLLIVVIVLCLGMMFITKHAPPAYVPDILVAYQHVLRVATYCYMLHVAIMWLELFPPTGKPNDWIMLIVNSSPLRLVLCMRFQDSTEYVAIQQHPWGEIAKILNNLHFIVITIVFLAIDAALLPNV